MRWLAFSCAAWALSATAGTVAVKADSLAVSARSGGGYEWNLNHSEDAATRANSAVVRAAVSVEADAIRGDSAEVYVDLGVDARRYQDYDDLSSVSEKVRVGLMWWPSRNGAIHVSGTGGLRQYRDGQRDSLDAGASASYRYRFAKVLAARLGYRFERHDAEVDAFDYDLHAVDGSVVIGGQLVDLGLGYTFERTDLTLYMDEQVAMTPTGRGRRAQSVSTTFAAGEIAYSEQVYAHFGNADLTIRPNRLVSLVVAYQVGGSDTSLGWVLDHAVSASVRVRLRW